METETNTRDSRSSIELSRTSKGEYSWRVKVYLESNAPEAIAAARSQVLSTDDWLRANYLREGGG